MLKKIFFAAALIGMYPLCAEEATSTEKLAAALSSIAKTREVFTLLKANSSQENITALQFAEQNIIPLFGKAIPSYFCPQPLDQELYEVIFTSNDKKQYEATVKEWATANGLSFEEAETAFQNIKHCFLIAHMTFMMEATKKNASLNEEETKKIMHVNNLLEEHMSHLYKLEGVA